MLPKRSTPVDQNFSSENTHSQLSVAIFIASRNLLGARESLIYKKSPKTAKHRSNPPLWSYFCAISKTYPRWSMDICQNIHGYVSNQYPLYIQNGAWIFARISMDIYPCDIQKMFKKCFKNSVYISRNVHSINAKIFWLLTISLLKNL